MWGCRDSRWDSTYPVADDTAEALGAWQAGVSYAALPALQTRAQLVSPTKEPTVDLSPSLTRPPTWAPWPQTSPTWKPRTPGAPGGPCGPRAP